MMTNTVVSNRLEDLTGKVFGLLTVLNQEKSELDGCGTTRARWKVRCAGCGTEYITKARYLKRGTESCTNKKCRDQAKAMRENKP